MRSLLRVAVVARPVLPVSGPAAWSHVLVVCLFIFFLLFFVS